ncbi:MAG: TolB family protein [bacterium]
MKSVSSWKKPNHNNQGLVYPMTYLLVLVCCTNAVCQSSTAIPNFDPKGKMLFIEDCDGEGGLLSFKFGDIVIFNPETKEKTRLTNDRYYDTHPSWSPDGQKIIFESKRIDNGDRIFDLSDRSHLFILDIKSGQIQQFDRDLEKLHIGEIGEENRRPAWSPASNSIAFLTRVDYRTKMVVLDIDKNIVTTLIPPGQFGDIDRLRWSLKEDYLAFDFQIKGTLINRGIAILNLQSKKTRVVSDSSQSCIIGSWSSDGAKLLFDGFVPLGKGPHFFYEYSLLSERSSLIIDMPSGLTGMKGQYGLDDSLIAFIGDSSGDDGLDIWTYGLLNNNPTKLTTEGHEKDGLMWYVKR